MWHKPCRTFHPWCLCIKTRCLFTYSALMIMLSAYNCCYSIKLLIYGLTSVSDYSEILTLWPIDAIRRWISWVNPVSWNCFLPNGIKPLHEPMLIYHNRFLGLSFTWMQFHDDVIKWKNFPRYWPFVRGIHRSPVNSPHKGQWRGALIFSLISVWINGWVNNREDGDLRRCHAHYDVGVMFKRGAQNTNQ